MDELHRQMKVAAALRRAEARRKNVFRVRYGEVNQWLPAHSRIQNWMLQWEYILQQEFNKHDDSNPAND